jgi:hypothetical protein
MKKIFFVLTFCLALLAAGQTRGQVVQDTTILYKVDTKDGNEFLGRIRYKDTLEVKLITENYGDIIIRTGNIKRIEMITVEKIKEGKIWNENFQDARYFFSPNGYGLRKGEVYYQNVWVLFNQFSAGITNNFSLGGGIVPAFLFAGLATPVWIIPKVSVPIVKDKLNVGAGALVGYVIGQQGSGFGILYGTGTLGSRDKNVSLGIGYGWAAGEFTRNPVLNLSVLIRTSPRSYFMSENYYLYVDDANLFILSMGGRSVIKRIGLDYGLFVPISEDLESFVAIPWLGLTVPLSKPVTSIPNKK